ncbi:MAG: D-cysteine desulfhydrase family protein [Pseudomonadota bacterium]
MTDTALGCLDALPRTCLYPDPTPIERLERLSAANAGAAIWVKRDDAHPLAFGGNKVRQLEFSFGKAQAEGADTVLITGAVQSNYCRLAAAYAARLGMDCHIQHEERVSGVSGLYRQSGNVLVEKLLGARFHSFHVGEDESGADRALEELAAKLRAEGRKPYVIHLGPGHPPLGALGYVVAARELLVQMAERGLRPDRIVVPSGSGATHSGFLFGMRALGDRTPISGICVRRAASLQRPRIAARCAEIADLLGVKNPVTEADIIVNDRFLGPGYGMLNLPTERAIRMAARTEAMILDPVYTGKCMAGVLAVAGNMAPSATVLFFHTGGTPGIFAYADQIGSIGERSPEMTKV